MLKKALIWGAAWAGGAVTFYFNREIGVLTVPAIIFTLSFVTERENVWVWIPAFILSWLWVFLARDSYSGYNSFTYSIFGVSVFPIVAWPSMLAGMHFLVFVRIKGKNRWYNFLKYFGCFSFFLILAEYIGYNIAGVKLSSGTAYPGWPVLNIFHCPWWMQVGYFLNGFVFSAIIAYFSDRKDSWNYVRQRVN